VKARIPPVLDLFDGTSVSSLNTLDHSEFPQVSVLAMRVSSHLILQFQVFSESQDFPSATLRIVP
jgi:hypothetical protein